jgi:hypothetical protein
MPKPPPLFPALLLSQNPAGRLAANTFQMRVRVPAGGRTTVTYNAENG